MNHKQSILKAAFLLLIPLLLIACSKQAKKERHLKNATEYLAAKEYNKSEIEFLNVLRIEPTNSAAISGLASIYFDRGQFDRALPAYLHLKSKGNSGPETQFKIAQIYLLAGDLPKARQEFTPLLDGKPEHDEALILLADASKNLKDLVDAQKRLLTLQSAAGSRTSWHLAMAAIALKQTNYSAAKGYLDKAHAIDPKSSRVHFALGNYFWSQKDIAQAGSFYQKAAELEPLTSPYRLRWVDFKLKNNATNDALVILKEITEKAPNHSPAWTYLARLAFAEKNLPQGSNYVQKVLALDPTDIEANLMQADLLRLSGNVDQSVKNLEKLKEQYPRSAQIAYSLGVACVQSRNPSKAVSTLIEGNKLDPNHVPTILILSELHIQRRELTPAIALLNGLLKKRPDITQAYFLLASALTAQNRYADALALYQQVEKAAPGNAQAPFFAGVTYRSQNRPAEARRSFERALAAAPNDPLVIGQLLDLDLQEKNYAAAMQRAKAYAAVKDRQAIGHFFEARVHLAQTNNVAAAAALEKAIAADPQFTSAYGILAQTYVKLDKTKEALARLDALQAKDPRSLPAIVMSGNLLQETGNFKVAAEKFKKALDVSPNFVPALNNLAYILAEKLGNLKEAETYARKGREIDPSEAHIADTLGWIHYRQKDYSLALPLVQEAQTKLPDSAEVQFHAGMTYYMMGIADAAQAAFNKALAASTQFPGRNEIAARLAILSLAENDSTPKTLQFLKDHLQKQPDDLLALTKLGSIYLRTGKPQEALQTFQNAKKINSSSATVFAGIGKSLQAIGKSNEAIEAAQEARKLAPNDTEVAHLLGRLTYDSGDHRRSIPLLEEASRAAKPEIYFDLAEAYFAVGLLERAEDAAARAKTPAATNLLNVIKLLKTPASLPQNEAFVAAINRGQPNGLPGLSLTSFLLKEKGNTSQATASLESLLKEYPQFTPGRIALGSIYLHGANQVDKAFEQATEARKTAAEDPNLSRLLGEIYFKKNEYRPAIPLLRAALREFPKDPNILYPLGISLHHQKDTEEANKTLNEALKLAPGSPYASEAKKLLTPAPKKANS